MHAVGARARASESLCDVCAACAPRPLPAEEEAEAARKLHRGAAAQACRDAHTVVRTRSHTGGACLLISLVPFSASLPAPPPKPEDFYDVILSDSDFTPDALQSEPPADTEMTEAAPVRRVSLSATPSSLTRHTQWETGADEFTLACELSAAAAGLRAAPLPRTLRAPGVGGVRGRARMGRGGRLIIDRARVPAAERVSAGVLEDEPCEELCNPRCPRTRTRQSLCALTRLCVQARLAGGPVQVWDPAAPRAHRRRRPPAAAVRSDR